MPVPASMAWTTASGLASRSEPARFQASNRAAPSWMASATSSAMCRCPSRSSAPGKQLKMRPSGGVK